MCRDFVAAQDEGDVIDESCTLILDQFDGIVPPFNHSLNTAFVNITKKSTTSKFIPAEDGTWPDDKDAFVLALNLSLPVTLYLLHALANEMAKHQITVMDESNFPSPSQSQEEDKLPGTITAWNDAIAEKMEGFSSSIKSMLTFTVQTNTETNDDQIVVNEEPTDHRVSISQQLRESLRDSPVFSGSRELISLWTQEGKFTIMNHTLEPSTPAINSLEHMTTAATLGQNLKRSKRDRLAQFFGRCCGRSRKESAQVWNDDDSNVPNPGSLMHKTTLRLSIAPGVMSSAAESEVIDKDPLLCAEWLLQRITELFHIMQSLSKLVIIDYCVCPDAVRLQNCDTAEVKKLLRRGSSWKGDCDDNTAKRVADVVTRQLFAYFGYQLRPETTMIQFAERKSLKLVVTPRPMVCGDHIYRRISRSGALGLMTHHGIYVGNGNVVHYSGNESALNSLLLPDHKATKLRKTSIYKFVSGQHDIRIRQYIRMACEHGEIGYCAENCANHRPLAVPDDLVYKKRHIIVGEIRCEAPWYTIGDCYENVVRRAEYAYRMFHLNQEKVVVEDESNDPEQPNQAIINSRDSSDLPVIYSFPAYNLFRSNCEHFASWCATGWGFSLQVCGLETGVHHILRGLK